MLLLLTLFVLDVPNTSVLALEKCTHLYDDTQGTIKHKRF